MVENKILDIISNELAEYLIRDSIGFYTSNRTYKYVFSIKDCEIEILYEFVDDFYKIKIENKKNNLFSNVILLTKSKKYHKEVKKQLKDYKISLKSFENHILCFVRLIKQYIIISGGLNLFYESYDQTLKFDGIFI